MWAAPRYHVGCTQVPCGLHPGTMWAAPRYHVGCTQVPRGLYMGFIWVLCGFNLCPTWVPIISPYGTHTVPICNAYMGPSWENSYRAHMEDYVGPIWDPSGCAGWEGQWRSISTELSPNRHRGWPPHPLQRSGGCNTIIEEREVSCSRQHPRRTGPSRWRGCNHRSHDNPQQDLADRWMGNPMDPVLSRHASQERQPAAVP